MRRLLSLTLALVAGFFVINAPAAVAGGPTSVLLANYETGRSAAALNGSAAYAELQSILGDGSPPTAVGTPPGRVKEASAQVRLVWLIHDVSPWRIDNVHVAASEVWVESYVDTSGTDPYSGAPIWHQPARGADLITSLTALGVLGTGTPDVGGSTTARDAVPPGAVTDTVAPPATVGISWLLASGLAAGSLLLGATLGALLPRRRPRLHHPSRRVQALG